LYSLSYSVLSNDDAAPAIHWIQRAVSAAPSSPPYLTLAAVLNLKENMVDAAVPAADADDGDGDDALDNQARYHSLKNI
jgi:hypothetical protein